MIKKITNTSSRLFTGHKPDLWFNAIRYKKKRDHSALSAPFGTIFAGGGKRLPGKTSTAHSKPEIYHHFVKHTHNYQGVFRYDPASRESPVKREVIRPPYGRECFIASIFITSNTGNHETNMYKAYAKDDEDTVSSMFPECLIIK
jgi:hypothetical protein